MILLIKLLRGMDRKHISNSQRLVWLFFCVHSQTQSSATCPKSQHFSARVCITRSLQTPQPVPFTFHTCVHSSCSASMASCPTERGAWRLLLVWGASGTHAPLFLLHVLQLDAPGAPSVRSTGAAFWTTAHCFQSHCSTHLLAKGWFSNAVITTLSKFVTAKGSRKSCQGLSVIS